MEAAEVELIAKFSLDLLTQAVMSHAADKVGAQLRRALFGSNDFQPCFTFGLIRSVGEECISFLIRHCGSVHFVVEDRVGDGAQIKLQLIQPQREIAVAIALIEHHLLGVHSPAFDKHAGLQDSSKQRRTAV